MCWSSASGFTAAALLQIVKYKEDTETQTHAHTRLKILKNGCDSWIYCILIIQECESYTE